VPRGTCGSKVRIAGTEGEVSLHGRRGRDQGGRVATRGAWPGPRGTCCHKQGVAGTEGDVWPQGGVARTGGDVWPQGGCGRDRGGRVAAR